MSRSPLLRIAITGFVVWITPFAAFAQAPPPQVPLTPADTTFFQQFGWALAGSGDTVVVGAPQDSALGFYNAGAAYVFARSGDAWIEQAKLTADDAANFSQFGGAVAVHGDRIAVGARYDSANAGAAYVFTRQGGLWTQQAKLTPGDAVPGKEFGCAVAVDGDVLAVGAMADGQGAFNAGAVYVFEWADPAWIQTAKLGSPRPQPGDLLGFAVAVAGDSVVVGAPFDDGAGLDAGAAYVFTRQSSGWGQQAALFAGDPAPADVFGWSVAAAADRVLIGAPQKSGSTAWEGAAYLWVRTASLWTPEAKLVAPSSGAEDYFGYAVTLDGSRAAIGAPFNSAKAQVGGTAYSFRHDGMTWRPEYGLYPGEARDGDQFGWSVALAGSWLAVGAPFNDLAAGFDNGAACVFALATPNSPPVADASATPGEVLAMNGVDALVTLDASRSSDPDHDPLIFTWSVAGATLATGSPAVVTLPVGIHDITLVVSDGALSATTVVTVAVIPPLNALPTADASATVGEAISPNNQDAEVLLDGSRSADPDGDPLTFTWLEGMAELGAGRLLRVRLPVGEHPVTLVVADRQGSGQDAVTVRVITAAAATRSLIQAVEAADLAPSRRAMILAILRAAERCFERGRMNAAAHHLMVFQRVVQAREGTKPDRTGVAWFVRAAQRIIDAVPHR